MGKKRHTAEQIIGKLRTAEIELAKGLSTAEVVRKLGITEQTYYRWRKEYGGLRLDQAKRLPLSMNRVHKIAGEKAVGSSPAFASGPVKRHIGHPYGHA